MDVGTEARNAKRHIGVSSLIVASFLGGVGACCWLLAANEGLVERDRRIPWRRIAILTFAAELGLIAVAFAQWLPWDVGFVVVTGGIASLCWLSHRRYGDLRMHTPPFDPREASWVGCVFLLARLGAVLPLVWRH